MEMAIPRVHHHLRHGHSCCFKYQLKLLNFIFISLGRFWPKSGNEAVKTSLAWSKTSLKQRKDSYLAIVNRIINLFQACPQLYTFQ
jgi:hypothetical protein